MSWSDIAAVALGVAGIAVFFGIAASPLVLRDYVQWAGAHRDWKEFARRARLSWKGRFVLSGRWELSGLVDGVRIVATADRTNTSVVAVPVIESSVSLIPLGLLTGRGAPTGDPELDKAAALSATPLRIASLDSSTRASLCEAAKHGVQASNGNVRFSATKRISASDPIEPIVRGVSRIALAFRIRPLSEDLALAAKNAVTDPLPSFRRACLRALANEPQAADVFARAAADVGEDPDLGVRSFRAIRHGTPQERLQFARTLAPADCEPLLFAAVADDALPEAEEMLLTRLREGDERIQKMVVETLAKIGGRTAIQPLHEATPGLLGDRDLKAEIAIAISSIQSRLEGAGEGQLALAADDASGALSEAQRAGALSLPQRK